MSKISIKTLQKIKREDAKNANTALMPVIKFVEKFIADVKEGDPKEGIIEGILLRLKRNISFPSFVTPEEREVLFNAAINNIEPPVAELIKNVEGLPDMNKPIPDQSKEEE